MEQINAVELLRGLFDTVLEKAEKDPKFAKDLILALPIGANVSIETKRKAPQKKAVDMTSIHPVNMLRDGQEDLLKLELKKLTIANLKELIKNHGLRITGLSKMNKGQLCESIVTASQRRIENLDAQAA